jgi:hypothetical protein
MYRDNLTYFLYTENLCNTGGVRHRRQSTAQLSFTDNMYIDTAIKFDLLAHLSYTDELTEPEYTDRFYKASMQFTNSW